MSDSNDAFTDDPEKNASNILSKLPRGIASLPPGLAAAAKLAANLRPTLLDSPAVEFARRAQEQMQQHVRSLEIARSMSEALGRDNALSQMMAVEHRHRQILADAQLLFADRHAMAAIPFETQLAREQAIALQTQRLLQSVTSARDIIDSFDRLKEEGDWVLDSTQPTIVLPMSVVDATDKSNEGDIIVACSIAWFAIMREVERDPDFLFQFVKHPRNFEEFIAASYDRSGFEVTLTPASGDLGRDVIARVAVPGAGKVLIYDQVKAYKPGHRVTAEDVRAIAGVIYRDQNVSKGLITTSSEFAPGAAKEFGAFMPTRLELRDGRKLREWLVSLLDE